MSTSVASRAAIRTHHHVGEGRDAAAFDRLRLMATYSRGYSVICDCCANDGDRDEENCGGLRVYNWCGNPVAVFRGTQYRAIENASGAISVYSTLVRC